MVARTQALTPAQEATIRAWKGTGVSPALVLRLREVGVLDGQIVHWGELQQSCGYSDDAIVSAARVAHLVTEKTILGW